jgi:hypothetical protein
MQIDGDWRKHEKAPALLPELFLKSKTILFLFENNFVYFKGNYFRNALNCNNDA